MIRTIKINSKDNVAIVTRDVKRGEMLDIGIEAREDIPQGHKVALAHLRQGDEVLRYGVVLGTLKKDVEKGDLIGEHDLNLPLSPALSELVWPGGPEYEKPIQTEHVPYFMGYDNGEGKFAGTRNILAISTTVQCVKGVVEAALSRIRNELLPKYPNVDGVTALTHSYGCGVAIDAKDAAIPIRCVKNLMYNPNFGNEIMVIALGCEKLTLERLLDEEEIDSENVLVLQDCKGANEMVDSIIDMAERKLEKLDKRKRTPCSLDKLCIGVQCGGSDAFSGITANPSIGYCSDLLTGYGAAVMFSEVTEVRDGVHLLAKRCNNRKAFEDLIREISWYDEYLAKGNVDRSANPTPGNKKGGLSNIVEKAMGSIAKSGTAPIARVLGPGEKNDAHGLIFAATPASDFVCGPTQLASGISLQIFSTGRGTPYGLREIPVLKIASQNTIYSRWPGIFDISAGDIIDKDKSFEDIGKRLFELVLETASGKLCQAERNGFYNDIVIDNPAPIT